jgi:hypothetical protein
MAGLIKEIWRKEIIGSLYKDNDFLKWCFDASEFVKDGTIVHIPQAGIPSNVEVDRTSLPATISERTDSDIVYTLKEFTSDPKLVRNIDKIQLSYNKVQSVISEDMDNLREKVADWMLRLWTPASAGAIMRTTGDAIVGKAPSATGNRKALVPADFAAAQLFMDDQNVPKANRKAIVPARMMATMLTNLELWKRDVGGELDLKEGRIARLYGFDIVTRSTVNIYDNTGTPVAKNPGASAAATDNLASLFWHPSAVEGALGNVDAFYKLNDPTYYGDIFSFLLMAGGRIRRADNKGVIAMVEAASA